MFRILVIPLFVSPIACFAACPDVTETATASKPSALGELSGLAASIDHPGVLYGHNDSGDTARFYALDTDGAPRATLVLTGVTAVDWEDIAVAGIGGESWVYIADTGNNDLLRTEVAVYRIPEPDIPAANVIVNLSGAERFRIAYSGTTEDAEGLCVEPESGALILVTRDRNDSGASRVYRAEPKDDGSVATAVAFRTLPDPNGGFRCKAADWYPGRRFAILRHSNNSGLTQLLTWPAPAGTPFITIITGTPCIDALSSFEQAEALCILPGGNEVIVGGEGDTDPLRRYQIVDPPSASWNVK